MRASGKQLQFSDLQKPEELLHLIKNERLRLLIANIALDGMKLPGDPTPAWAASAAREFWKCCQDLPKKKQAKSENYRVGFLLGLVSRLPMPSTAVVEPALLSVASPEHLSGLAHAEYAKASKSEAADFYSGFADGLKREVLSPRSPYAVYLCLALLWPELSQFKSVPKLHSWLEQNLGRNIAGSRERIAKLCQKVRFPLTDKGGRPRRKPRKAPAT